MIEAGLGRVLPIFVAFGNNATGKWQKYTETGTDVKFEYEILSEYRANKHVAQRE